jgi:hypothetical protein
VTGTCLFIDGGLVMKQPEQQQQLTDALISSDLTAALLSLAATRLFAKPEPLPSVLGHEMTGPFAGLPCPTRNRHSKPGG